MVQLIVASKESSKDDLDDLDVKILRLLQSNSRIPFSDISRRLGVPEATIRYRVKKLLEKGVIRGFYTLIDPNKVGFPFSVIILADIDPDRLNYVFDELRSMPEAAHVFKLTGKYNIVAIFHVRSMNHISEIDEKIRSLEGIKSAETLLVTGLVHINPELPI